LFLLAEKVLADGEPKNLEAVADTSAEALAKAEAQVPSDAQIVSRKETLVPGHVTVTVEAFDEQEARSALHGRVYPAASVTSIKVTDPGPKGFLGIWRRPGHFAHLRRRSTLGARPGRHTGCISGVRRRGASVPSVLPDVP
jgi:hypothetical protein